MADRTDIPTLFHSEYADGPFEECAVCKKSLLQGDVSYSVSKTCNQGEAIVEMAVCADCGSDLGDEMSDASRQGITEFIQSRLMSAALETDPGESPNSRFLKVLAPPDDPPEDPLELVANCMLCSKPRGDCRTFSVTAFCVGGKMVVEPAGPLSLGIPAMICDECNDEVNAKLSKETRDTWNRFYDDYVDTPPRITLDGPMPLMGL